MVKSLLYFILLIPSVSFSNDRTQYSRSLVPKFSKDYYIDQSLRYFDTLDTYANRESKPLYSSHVIRWEWYPWLYLTGYKKYMMKLDRLLILYPTKVINRKCRFFKLQPFGRCKVTFHYEWAKEFIDIYEEFTFNDKGEMTFIEAWSDIKGYTPMDSDTDPWAEGKNIKRISTKIPGLGSKDGLLSLEELAKNSMTDSELADLNKRLESPIYFWIKEAFRFIKTGHKVR